ncbi:T9SS type A sorting domain-containing protein [Aquimarina rhabdastrellae]
MRRRKLLIPLSVLSLLAVGTYYFDSNTQTQDVAVKKIATKQEKKKKKKKTLEDRRLHVEERLKYEFELQKDPISGVIPKAEVEKELLMAKNLKESQKNSSTNASNNDYISRGPSNLGGRTRSVVIDKSDATGNTMISGGVSSGVFRTTDGGAKWTKVSSNQEIHNVTTIVQDPRAGSENIWYYGTGEFAGNSAGASGASYNGQGIWQSTDNGLTWTQMPTTASQQEAGNDSVFDFVHKLVVHPISGELIAATFGGVYRFNGTSWIQEFDLTSSTQFSDVAITSTGITYVSISARANASLEGVWRSDNPNGPSSWTRIGSNTSPGFGAISRNVIAIAPSNENIVYSFMHTANDPSQAVQVIQAGLWQWNDATDTWTNYSSKMPDEAGGNLSGNDPISVQGGYDMIVSVKPDNENFVVIGGTNVYKIEDITTDPMFTRIGGYINNSSYGLYNRGGGDDHHPDIHALVFDPNNPNRLFSGTDGGVHRTDDVDAGTVAWTSLNNDYQTYQFYHVAIDPQAGSDTVIGGAQDNGTVAGGTNFGRPDLTSMSSVGGGDGVAVAISRDNSCIPFFFGSQFGRIRRDCPNGQIITPAGSSSEFVTYFYLDPSNNNALYYAGRGNLIYTTDASNVTSNSWLDIGALANNELISTMATSWGDYDTSTSYLLIGGNRGNLFRLDDPQNKFNISNAVNITPSGATNGANVSGIAVHPNNRDIVMVTYSSYGSSVRNIFVTTNATSANPTWTEVERNLASFSIRAAAITEVNGETRYFVGTARGLYSSIDPTSNDWVIESPDQIGFAVARSLAYRPADNQLLIGTHGNGMYMATVRPLSVDEFDAASDNAITMYPNPTSSELNISLESSFVEGDLDYSVVDLTGKVVKRGTLSSDKKVNVQDLTNGVYFLQLASSNRTKTSKFIKI